MLSVTSRISDPYTRLVYDTTPQVQFILCSLVEQYIYSKKTQGIIVLVK